MMFQGRYGGSRAGEGVFGDRRRGLSDLGVMQLCGQQTTGSLVEAGRSKRRKPSSSDDAVPCPVTGAITNAFTVDLEDWAHGLLGGDTPITPRVLRNVERVLALLDRHDIRATFFALGKVCEKFPRLLPMIAAGGHEIASHGYGHDSVFKMTPDDFRDDVCRSIDIIGEQVGEAPIGYRAPAFSITRQSLWAGPILAELGFEYSSSIFPIRGRRYGIADAPRYPFRWDSEACVAEHPANLIEFPMTTLAVAGRRIPVCGGGYLRLLPAYFLKTAIQQAHRRSQPAVVYIHPYELDVREVAELQGAGWKFDRAVAFKQSLFRRRVEPRLAGILRTFKFAPMREALRVHGMRGSNA